MKQNYQRFGPDFKNNPPPKKGAQSRFLGHETNRFCSQSLPLNWVLDIEKKSMRRKHNQTQSTTKTNQTEMAKIFQTTNRHKFLR